jgi:hypothetical protein
MNQIEAMKQALDALINYDMLGVPEIEDAIASLRAAIEAALKPREPVAYRYWDVEGGWRYGEACYAEKDDELLYTAAPQPQQWVGLTETDLANCDTDEYETARRWERLLRERNGGGV